MSSLMREPDLGPQALQLQWLNTIVTTHGLICSCEQPWKHLQQLLNTKNGKWLYIGDGTDAATQTGKEENHIKEEDPIDEGILEELFKEDFDDTR
ncbi:hypothetical protein ORF2 [Torque teno mini virus 10]|uniref:Hepatitis TT virus Orf2/Gyrovirus Vp2 N-terminal domain-containing protein n=1 Tax=Torque teno mini virus 10 TaxID=2065036 RepID=A0A451ENN3_9VIRU|nr:hypothetical protein ORF2 [Torque teno mini virus 10]AZK35874.1 hypothetical protein ORF2 [Torque teno mini virus 10]